MVIVGARAAFATLPDGEGGQVLINQNASRRPC